MAQGAALLVSALNISANPHPPGIYIRLLAKVAGIKINFRAKDSAKITKPVEDKKNAGVYTGRILVWTDIDTNAPWLDDERDEILSDADKAKINIPRNAKPNYRVFNYVFKEKGHRLYVEARNEFGESFTVNTAQRVFFGLLDRAALAEKIDLDVTPVPKSGAVERVLALPGLRHLHIRVVLPNADVIDEAKRKRVLERLTDAKAKQLDETYTKKAGEDHLVATPEILETAKIAAENGFVTGVGRKNGKRVDASTTKQPRIETIPSNQAGGSFLSRLMGSIGLF
jgi:hypothetical protein